MRVRQMGRLAFLCALVPALLGGAPAEAAKKPKIVTKDFFVSEPDTSKRALRVEGFQATARCNGAADFPPATFRWEGRSENPGTIWYSTFDGSSHLRVVGEPMTSFENVSGQGELVYLAPDGKTVATLEYAMADPSGGDCLIAGTTSVAKKGAKEFIAEQFESHRDVTVFADKAFTAKAGCIPPISSASLLPTSIHQSAINGAIDSDAGSGPGLYQGGLYPPPTPLGPSRKAVGARGIGDYVYMDATGSVVSFKLGSDTINSDTCDFVGVVESESKRSSGRVLYTASPVSDSEKTKFYDDGQLELWADCHNDVPGNQHRMTVYARSETDDASIYYSAYRNGQADPALFEIEDLDDGEASEQQLLQFDNGPPGLLTRAGNLTYVSASGKVTTIDWAGAVQVGFEPCLFAGIAS